MYDDSINSIKKEQNVIINAGYKVGTGTIFMGTIQKCITTWDSVDKTTELTIGDGSQQWLEKHVSKTYEEGIRASAILRDLAGMFGLELGKFELVNDLTYHKGRAVNSMVKDALKQIVAECSSQFNISKGQIFVMPFNAGFETGFLLNSASGLIGSPKAFEKEEDGNTVKGYMVDMLLNHKITANSIIQIESKSANGIYRVVCGKHTGNYITSVEVRE